MVARIWRALGIGCLRLRRALVELHRPGGRWRRDAPGANRCTGAKRPRAARNVRRCSTAHRRGGIRTRVLRPWRPAAHRRSLLAAAQATRNQGHGREYRRLARESRRAPDAANGRSPLDAAITAGLAIALQNVILSVVAYFFLIGKYGV